MKRYELVLTHWHGKMPSIEAKLKATGDWVKFEDHLAALERCKKVRDQYLAELQELRKEKK